MEHSIPLHTGCYVPKKFFNAWFPHGIMAHLEVGPLCMKVSQNRFEQAALAFVLQSIQTGVVVQGCLKNRCTEKGHTVYTKNVYT